MWHFISLHLLEEKNNFPFGILVLCTASLIFHSIGATCKIHHKYLSKTFDEIQLKPSNKGKNKVTRTYDYENYSIITIFTSWSVSGCLFQMIQFCLFLPDSADVVLLWSPVCFLIIWPIWAASWFAFVFVVVFSFCLCLFFLSDDSWFCWRCLALISCLLLW